VFEGKLKSFITQRTLRFLASFASKKQDEEHCEPTGLEIY